MSLGSENTGSWLVQESFLFLLHRFNCGTGVAILVSETKVKLGAWHKVTLYRDGLNGLLQLNNDTPVTGQSQVSVSLSPCPAPAPTVSTPRRAHCREPRQTWQDASSGWAVFHGQPVQLSSAVPLLDPATLGGRSGHPSIPYLPERRTESVGIAAAVQEHARFPQGHQSQGRGRSPH